MSSPRDLLPQNGTPDTIAGWKTVRLALFPLRLDTDRTGYLNLPRSLGRQKWLLMEDVNTIRETNNGIFDDIFWAHLAYVSAEDGIGHLRGLLQGDGHRAPSSPASKRSTEGVVSSRTRPPAWKTGVRPRS